ncbi:MFS transporter [Dongia sedimenti]|uniref:MFS transporter n=1 Tax=Dongia sedimenti TaxID=3064282 RepID=A0ABU0YT34_9PROT|nr:MFS transporter [Rhodospirillaceae bacterium R-7]
MLAGWSRDFRALMAAFAVSSIGTKIAREAVPLTAVLVLQAGPGALSLLGAAATLPVLVLGLFAGVWVDRWRRRPLMIAADLLRFVAVVSIPVAAWCNVLTMTQLLAVVMAVAALSLLFMAADAAYLPSLVEAGRLAKANAARETIDATAEIVGPPIGGVLVQVLTAPAALLIDAVSYLVSALFLFRMTHSEPAVSQQTERRRTLHQIAEGLNALWHHPILRPLLLARAIRTFFGGMIGPFYVLYVVRHLGVSPAAMGVLIACGGVAALAGAALVPWLNARIPAGPGLIGAFAIKTVGLACMPLAGLLPVLMLPLLVLQQLLQDSVTSYFAVNERTLRQKLVPNSQLGRVAATIAVVNDGPIPLGALIAGLLVQVVSLDTVLWIAVAGYALSPLVALLSPVRRLRDI